MHARIRLLWDFFGPNAERTARHHCVHLDEFAEREGVAAAESGVEQVRDNHFAAWMVVQSADVDRVRVALRPQRGLAV
jgi:hypothetical protein